MTCHTRRGFSAGIASILVTLCLASGVHAQTTRGPYLQNGSATAVTVRWRTSSATNSRVRYGTTQGDLTFVTDDSTSTTEHEVRVTGLTADTKYFYSVGSTTAQQAGNDASHFFVTAPTTGTAKPTRIWVLGDAGTGTADQTAVRDAYYAYTGTRHTDLWVMLGDNAYSNSTDAEMQAKLFNIYPTMLRKSVFSATRGNHESANNTSGVLWHYLAITNPTGTEGGGVASGTEAYFSFNHGNIHFICLDSFGSSRSATGAMANWLRNDLAANTQTWTIAYWHHPPYSKGEHDSDTEAQLIEMRQNIVPILENGGVDLVLTGHSHNYERSYLLDGHYGLSNTLTSAMKLDGGSGRESGSGAYRKSSLTPTAHQGAVYAVAGSSGHAEGGALNHPAMFVSLSVVGSVVLDIDDTRLDAKFLRETGAIDDSFTILKSAPISAPPAPGGLQADSGNGQLRLRWNATSGAASYNLKRSLTAGGPYDVLGTGLTGTSYIDATVSNGTTYHYVVSGVSAAGNEGVDAAPVSATPVPFTNQDVGAVAAAGSFTAIGGTFSVRGSGADIYGTADEFHFVSQSLTGDGTITARMASVQNVNGWTKMGVMMRETTAAGSRNVMALVSPTLTNRYRFQSRLSSNGSSTSPSGGTGAVPVWLRITRTGNSFAGQLSSDGSTWSALSTAVTIAMPSTINVGLAITSHADGTLATGVFDNVTIVPAAPPSPPGAPTGLTASPGNGQNTLTWAGVGGATSYTVKTRAQSGGLTSTLQAGITGTSFVHSGLSNGTTYYYVVSASNVAGEGPESAETSSTPVLPPAPAAPAGLTATAGNDQVTLNWSASNGASSYTVKRSTTSDGPYSVVQAGATSPSFVDSTVNNGTAYYYVVSASNSGGESPDSSQVTATPNAPVVTWSTQDIGAVAAAGSWSEAGGTHTVKGSGADIYGTADEFRYVYRTITGNATITARVASVQLVNTWTKAGVMVRDGVAANARNVTVVTSPTTANGYRLQARTTAGGTTSTTKAGAGTNPVWLRLVRSGNNITAYTSSNGTSWTQIGATQNISLPSTVNVGLAVTSHTDGSLATATFDDVTIVVP